MLRFGRVGLVAMAVVVGAVAGTASARADEPSAADRARAAELVRKGTTAAKAKRWDECISALSQALAAEPSAATAGQLGLCEEQRGQYVAAYDHLSRALNDPATKPPGGAPNPLSAALARVLEHVAVVWITALPRETLVTLDGRLIGRADGRYFAVEPGTHIISARLDGYHDKEQSVYARAGDVPNVHLRLEPKPPSLPTGQNTARPTAPTLPLIPPPVTPWYMPAPSLRGVLVALAIASLATSLASGVTAVGLEVDRASIRGPLGNAACGPDATSPPAACGPLRDRAKQADTALAVTLGGVGAAGLFSGAAWLAYRQEQRSTNAAVVPVITPNGAAIVVQGSW